MGFASVASLVTVAAHGLSEQGATIDLGLLAIFTAVLAAVHRFTLSARESGAPTILGFLVLTQLVHHFAQAGTGHSSASNSGHLSASMLMGHAVATVSLAGLLVACERLIWRDERRALSGMMAMLSKLVAPVGTYELPRRIRPHQVNRQVSVRLRQAELRAVVRRGPPLVAS